MIDVKSIEGLMNKCSSVEECKMLLRTMLDEYNILEKEYNELEDQKLMLMMPAISEIIMSKTTDEDMTTLRRIVSSLKSNYAKCLNENKRLKSELDKLRG